MQVEQLHTSSGQLVAGPLLITPQVFGDYRGIFYESWNQRRFDEAVGAPPPLCRTTIRALAVAYCAACTTSWSPNPRENWCAARWG